MEELGTGEGVLRGKAGCEDCDCGTDYETEKGDAGPYRESVLPIWSFIAESAAI